VPLPHKSTAKPNAASLLRPALRSPNRACLASVLPTFRQMQSYDWTSDMLETLSGIVNGLIGSVGMG